MPRRLYQFDSPDDFVAGAIGEPGSRTFYLQARKADIVVTVSLEKLQVAALAQRIEDVLAAVGGQIDRAEDNDAASQLQPPIDEAFRVGPMALGWDAATAQLVIEAQPETDVDDFVDVPDGATDGPDVLRVRLVASAARTFARRATALVGAGRPTCPFCGEALDASGHFCLRSNGNLN